MISIIICSRTKTISNALLQNIQETVGCNYELIVIDNSQKQYSIFEAYNLAIEKSTGEYLCFLHDDIFIKTKNWGSIVNTIFKENTEIGLLGVAGTKIKTKMPSGWWNCPKEEKVIHIIQHVKNQNIVEKWDCGFDNKALVEVAAIDGVFMVLRTAARAQFNPKIKGFHNYDLNISFECRKLGYRITVTNEILLEHFSNGTMNKEWVDSTFKIHQLYHKILPITTENFSSQNLKKLEFENGVKYVNHALNFNLKKNALTVWLHLVTMKLYSKDYKKFSKKMVRLILK